MLRLRVGTELRITLVLAGFVTYQYFFFVHQPGPSQGATSRSAAAGKFSSLPDVIAASVGVHERSTSAEHDIIVLSANYGHLDFLINWVCTTGNVLNLKYLIVPQDEKLHAHLRDNTDLPVLNGSLLGVSGPADAVAFRSDGFNRISNMKLKAVAAILETLLESSPPQSRPHVLFSDVDIVWRRDPFNYLRRDVDLEIQSDNPTGLDEFWPRGMEQLCTGFYYAAANNRTMDLLQTSQGMARNDQYNVVDTLRALLAADRAVYVPRNARAPANPGDRLTFRALPPLSFPNGAFSKHVDYEQRRAAAGADLVIVHANWLTGSELKRARLHELGLWKVDKTETSCEGQLNCYGKSGKYWLQCAIEGQNVTLI